MTTTHIVSSARAPSYRGTPRRAAIDPGLLIAAALFVSVLIAGAVFVALAVPTIPDIAAIYVPVP
jgi:hypothetical protein